MKFIKDFVSLNFSQYDNFGFAFPIGFFITALLCAMCVAAFVLNYSCRCETALLKQLIRHGATDEDKAKTLQQLRLSGSRYIKHMLSRGSGRVCATVSRAGYTPPSYEDYVAASKKRGYKAEKIDFDTARFYLNGDNLKKAEGYVNTAHSELWRPIITAAVIICIFALLVAFLPDALALINSWAD